MSSSAINGGYPSRQDNLNFESINENVAYKGASTKLNMTEDHTNLKFAKSRNIDTIWAINKKNMNEENSDSSSLMKSSELKLNKQPSNPTKYTKRKRILSNSDFSRHDASESWLEESISNISRMNSLTK